MAKDVVLDSVDLALLRELQNDGRLPNKTLAQRIGVAPSTCLARTQRLIDSGVILGFRAEVSAAAIGRQVQAVLAVQFVSHSRPLVDPFVAWARSRPQTRALFHVTGAFDFLVQAACSDTEDLQELVLEFTGRREVGRVETHLVFGSWQGGPLTPG
ncbi:Lrp/AsnC family transcriptional regulator [Streptomyces sp. TS71-3]|uniref:Lrp/AsnC family transcriptional regulator n=1 Tax=Streptomyces sp. TS71-3 TaxID=2733862 RepID=UPI001B0EEF41|nr:Lrp/AsnC family transcriptional regulator [Streptomyces sp. TS71-3]GHJ40395.1 AsnC family transcriptional regulator [Streptomyces sp. TS71-3]